MGPGIYLVAVACFVLATACIAVGVVISFQRSRQPGWDSSEPPSARFRMWMGAGAVWSLIGAALMASTIF